MSLSSPAPVIETPHRLREEIALLLERSREVWMASEQHDATAKDEAIGLHNSLQSAAHYAPLYFRFAIPVWPPRLLLRKVLRRAMVPFWMGQVHFNESARESLFGLSRSIDRQNRNFTAQQKQIAQLENSVADLQSLLRQIADTAPVGANVAASIHALLPPPLPAETEAVPWAEPAQCLAALFVSSRATAAAPCPLYFAELDAENAPPADAPVTKPRAVFISPFPPAQSGVADYSAEIIVPLAAHYDLDLVTDDEAMPRLPFPFSSTPLGDWEKNKRPDYQAAFYQMGNNAHFHAQSYVLLLRYAGITVLHDYMLTHLITALCVDSPYLGLRLPDEIAYEVGQTRADKIVRDIRNGKLTTAEWNLSGVPMNRRIFTRSLGVVLHNQWSYEQAQKDRINDNELITLIPPVMPPVALNQTKSDIDALRKKWEVPANAFVFAPCGIVTQTKRPLAILDAFKVLLAERPDAFLLFVGSVSMPPDVDFEQEIEKRGLTERVKITGYVDVPTFNEYLLLSDVCVTLRFPSQGETSGALLRMLVHGKPSIVTAIGSFDDFPDDTVHKLPTPDKMTNEVGEILEAFRLLANDTAYREKIAANGLAYILREHSPERCARLYAQFVDEVMAHPATRRKLLADWAGRDIARRTQAGANGDALLAELGNALHLAAPAAAFVGI